MKLLLVIVIFVGAIYFVKTRYYDATPCPVWLSKLIEMDNPFCKVHAAETVVDNAHIQKGMVVLDAGCGPGRITIPLSQRVGLEGSVVAMDIQEGMLDIVRNKVNAANLGHVSLLHAGFGEKKLERYKFDRVLLVTVLGEIPDPQGALQEIYDALKPNGVLSITEIIFDPDFMRRSSVIRLAESVGFREVERFGNCLAYTLNFVKEKSTQTTRDMI